MSGIRISNLRKSYGSGRNRVVALADVNFEIAEGEFTVILGPSGSGKSTLLNVLGGMDRADSGKAVIFGSDITKFSSRQLVQYRRKSIGFVFQFYNLMPNLTALENVAIARCKGSMDERVALKSVGLSKRRSNFPSQLSGGEQQRVAIARAIVKKPHLLSALVRRADGRARFQDGTAHPRSVATTEKTVRDDGRRRDAQREARARRGSHRHPVGRTGDGKPRQRKSSLGG